MHPGDDQIDVVLFHNRREHRQYFSVIEHYLARYAVEMRTRQQSQYAALGFLSHASQFRGPLLQWNVSIGFRGNYMCHVEGGPETTGKGSGVGKRHGGPGRKVGRKENFREPDRKLL